jgi:hypothetical protein
MQCTEIRRLPNLVSFFTSEPRVTPLLSHSLVSYLSMCLFVFLIIGFVCACIFSSALRYHPLPPSYPPLRNRKELSVAPAVDHRGCVYRSVHTCQNVRRIPWNFFPDPLPPQLAEIRFDPGWGVVSSELLHLLLGWCFPTSGNKVIGAYYGQS